MPDLDWHFWKHKISRLWTSYFICNWPWLFPHPYSAGMRLLLPSSSKVEVVLTYLATSPWSLWSLRPFWPTLRFHVTIVRNIVFDAVKCVILVSIVKFISLSFEPYRHILAYLTTSKMAYDGWMIIWLRSRVIRSSLGTCLK